MPADERLGAKTRKDAAPKMSGAAESSFTGQRFGQNSGAGPNRSRDVHKKGSEKGSGIKPGELGQARKGGS